MADVLYLIPLLPLLGAIVCGVFHALGGGWKDRAGYVASAAVAGSFVVALLAFFAIPSGHGEGHEGAASLVYVGWTWLDIGVLQVPFKLVIDPLSGFMALVVTGVGLLIHIYSIGYIAHDECRAKFFAFLNLFIVSMSILILGASMPLLFVGWEGVGVMSYLLIGFWYDKENGWPAKAGQKAFITNRIGDLGFLLGMFFLLQHFGTLDFAEMQQGAAMEAGLATLACILLFFGATGKSAQIPLYVWLPDAMAGPTPVSALIHAATMVTAGVYMVARSSFLFVQSPTAMMVVAITGAITALVAATIALSQRDLKKVLAYSTVSQLGYMFMASASARGRPAIFHVFTHAFFKALLFLGAGSVIHGMHEEQDAFKMGGLKKHMKVTWITFLIGSLALAGFPLTSGFFSKDEILWYTVMGNTNLSWMLWIIGAITAALTAFYTFRLVGLTFLGKERFDPEKVHPHESPLSMTAPLMVLAALALLGGLLGLPEHVVHISNFMHHWLEPVTVAVAKPEGAMGYDMEILFIAISSVIAVVGILIGTAVYRRGPEGGAKLAKLLAPLHAGSYGKWFVDEIYEVFVLLPLAVLSKLAGWFDLAFVDGLVNGVGRAGRQIGVQWRRVQDGQIQTYAVWMAVGVLVLAAFVLVPGFFGLGS
jgi:NADH-quinone oxidoreductase subunit L